MAIRPVQHQIETQAEALFHTQYPSEWNKSKLSPDYGKDYLCEVFQKGVKTAVEFYTQLKGTTKNGKGKRCKAYIAYPLEVPFLLDCLKRWQLPGFLMVADLDQGEVYYCFLQQYIIEHLAETGWQTKGEVTIRCPFENQLRNHDKLLRDCEQATAYFVTHHIKLEELRLEAKDPRFEVKITATSITRNYELRAKSPVEFGIEFRDDSESMEKLLHGHTVIINSNNCTLTGTPLLEIAPLESIRVAADDEVAVVLIARDKENREILAIPGIKGMRTRSKKEIRFKSNAGKAFRFQIEATNTIGRFQLEIDLANWREQYLTRLEGFDDVCNLVEAALKDATFSIEGVYDKESVVGAIPMEEKPRFYQMQWFLTILKMGRDLASLFNIKPRLPLRCSDKQLRDVHRLYTFASVGSIAELGGGTLTAISSTGIDRKFSGPLAFIFEAPWAIFDEIVPLNTRQEIERFKIIKYTKSGGDYLMTLAVHKTSRWRVENLDPRRLPGECPLFARPPDAP